MNRMTLSAAVYGGLLALLSAGAWAKYTAAPALELDGKVVLLQGEEAELEGITWLADKKDKAVIVKKTDAAGEYWEVTYTKWTEKKAPAAPPTETPAPTEGAPAGPSATPEATPAPAPAAEAGAAPTFEESTQVWKAGEEAGKLAKSLSPLLAIRKLELTPDKLETTGLDKVEEFLEITRKGKTIKLEVGGEVYGTRDRYVRDTSTQEVFLVDDELLRPLKYARTRLPDRTLWSLDPQKVSKVTIGGGTGSLEVLHKNAQDIEKAAWVRASAPDATDEQLKTWMDKALKLKSTAYAESTDTFDGLELKFSLRLEDEKGKAETLQVFSTPDGKGDWWAKSEHTRGYVKLLKGPTSSLHEDVAGLIGG